MARAVNRLLVFLVGAAMLAGGLLIGVEAVWAWTGSGFVWIPGREWLSSFETTPWSSNVVVGISVGVAVLGFVLVLVELRPQRKRVATFDTDHGEWELLRRSTEAHLSRRLASAVPTTPIKTRLSPRALRWKVTVRARAAASTTPVLEAAARQELEKLHAPSVNLKVRATGARKT